MRPGNPAHGGRDTGGKQLGSEREFDAHVKAEIRTNAALINAAGIKLPKSSRPLS